VSVTKLPNSTKKPHFIIPQNVQNLQINYSSQSPNSVFVPPFSNHFKPPPKSPTYLKNTQSLPKKSIRHFRVPVRLHSSCFPCFFAPQILNLFLFQSVVFAAPSFLADRGLKQRFRLNFLEFKNSGFALSFWHLDKAVSTLFFWQLKRSNLI
jgi:hypothetical protein